VTGATAGIGRAFADALAAEGHELVLVARTESRLHETADELAARHGVATEVLPADLTELTDTQHVEDRLAKEPFDVLVNNAGFGLNRPFQVNDVELEQQSMDVLVRAVMRLTHAALGPMLARGHGEIVNVSSVAAFLPRGTYGAHKAWVRSFSAWGNVRYRKSGIRMMALCPGLVRTEFHQRQGAAMHGVPDLMWLDADDVVQQALGDLRAGKAVSVPSLRYKALVGLAQVAPRTIVERVSRRGR
jgi:short-subunit dehydrogenase